MTALFTLIVRLLGVLSLVEVALLISSIAYKGLWLGAGMGLGVLSFSAMAVVGLFATVTVTEADR